MLLVQGYVLRGEFVPQISPLATPDVPKFGKERDGASSEVI